MLHTLTPMECAVAEMRETNRHLQLLTQNLDGLTVDPMGGFQLGDGSPVGKRPFYADRTTACCTADHDTTPLIFFDPAPNTWKAISWFQFSSKDNIAIHIYKDTRDSGGLPVPVVPVNGDGVICDKRILISGDVEDNTVFLTNFFPSAFLIAPDEVLWITAPVNNGIIIVVFGWTQGKF